MNFCLYMYLQFVNQNPNIIKHSQNHKLKCQKNIKYMYYKSFDVLRLLKRIRFKGHECPISGFSKIK